MARHNDKPWSERVAEADMRGNNWLAKGNEYAEAGNTKKAEECYSKGQYWLDKSNALRVGWIGDTDRNPFPKDQITRNT